MDDSFLSYFFEEEIDVLRRGPLLEDGLFPQRGPRESFPRPEQYLFTFAHRALLRMLDNFPSWSSTFNWACGVSPLDTPLFAWSSLAHLFPPLPCFSSTRPSSPSGAFPVAPVETLRFRRRFSVFPRTTDKFSALPLFDPRMSFLDSLSFGTAAEDNRLLFW